MGGFLGIGGSSSKPQTIQAPAPVSAPTKDVGEDAGKKRRKKLMTKSDTLLAQGSSDSTTMGGTLLS